MFGVISNQVNMKLMCNFRSYCHGFPSTLTLPGFRVVERESSTGQKKQGFPFANFFWQTQTQTSICEKILANANANDRLRRSAFWQMQAQTQMTARFRKRLPFFAKVSTAVQNQ